MQLRLVGPLVAAVLIYVCAAARAQPSEQAPPATAAPALSDSTARALVDSLLERVVALRGLEATRALDVRVAARAAVRARLEEIIEEENLTPEAREEERVLKYLGLVPRDVDLLELYKDLIEEQLAGMYDIDQRVLVLADWLPLDMQTMVVTHEIVHALQDQNFSLRVRKKLGFKTPDAEAAWHALIEGDATASMLQAALAKAGRSFAAFVDSLPARGWATLLEGTAPVETQHMRSAPKVIRDAIGFPYEKGLAFVTALYREGGWSRVDQAFVHPPVSTEQILHPERFLPEEPDEPIRVEVPDVRGVLGAGYAPTANMPLGEYDLYLYLSGYVDAAIAEVASEGWGGAWLSLYGAPDDEPEALVLVTTWDTEEDALEFFGSVIGVLDKRYPEQSGDLEGTNANRITWNVDPEGRYQNIVRLVARHVQVLEQVPVAVAERTIQKLDRMTQFEDPSPRVRARAKEHLPWNRETRRLRADSALTLRVHLPRGWSPEGSDGRTDLLTRARRGQATLDVVIDREARDALGVSGYAHALAARIQEGGTGVYLQKDVGVPRDDGLELYEHVFSQTEDGNKVVYYIAVANLRRGFGYVVMAQPENGETPSVEPDFYELLRSLSAVPWEGPAETKTGSAGATARSDPRGG